MGYGDDCAACLEGQSLRLTGLPAGRYALVHRVNENGLLRGRRASNNAARCSWPCRGAAAARA